MTPVLFVLASSVGALGRHAVHQLVNTWQALLIVNVVGSGILGMVVAAELSVAATTVLGVGFCGAVTTYSGFALEFRRLDWRWAGAYAALMLTCTCGAAALGSAVAS